MIESAVNGIQLFVLLGCLIPAAVMTIRQKTLEFLYLTLFYGSFFLGDLYWQLFLLFYGRTPMFYISDLTWYAGLLFLSLLLREVMKEDRARVRRPVPWFGPVFTAAMGVFFMTRGDILMNLICAVLMGSLLWRALAGLIEKDRQYRNLYIVTLSYCLTMYALWVSSCFWGGDSLTNSYFWFDLLQTGHYFLFLPAMRKAEIHEYR